MPVEDARSLKRLSADQLQRHVRSVRWRISDEEEARIADECNMLFEKREILHTNNEYAQIADKYNALTDKIGMLEARKKGKVNERLTELGKEGISEAEKGSLF